MENTRVKAFLESINEGLTFNRLQVTTDSGETFSIADWKRRSLKEKTNYFLIIRENKGYLNLVSATSENGQEVV